MPLFVLYLEKLSIGLAVAWVFYQLLLRRLTFYSWNRWYLLGYTVLCFFIPLINLTKVIGVPWMDIGVKGAGTAQGAAIPLAPLILRYLPGMVPVAPDRSWYPLFLLLALGSAILLVRLGRGWLSLRMIRRRAILISNRGTGVEGPGGGVKIYQMDGRAAPFSFGNAIYINDRLHTEKEFGEIILHEYVHIRQRHSVDILMAELLCVFCWFNPFAWMIRYSIRQNLEFIADSKVLENGFDRKGYQYHLLKVIGEPQYRLANNFNFSSLKKRIIMMNKIRTARLHILRFLFLLPLIAVLLVAFRGQLAAARGNVLPTHAAVLPAAADAVLRKDSVPSNTEVTREGPGRPFKMEVQPIIQSKQIDSGRQRSNPIYIVDGKEGTAEILKGLDPRDILSVNVWKDEGAIEAYGEKGRNGVIEIKTKGGGRTPGAGDSALRQVYISIDSTVVTIDDKKGSQVSHSRGAKVIGSVGFGQPELTSIIIADGFKGLILVDGKEVSNSMFKSMNPLKITSYNIITGEVAVTLYGEKARQGAIVIELK